ncbi:thioredoxin domain-containing protein [Nocardioides jiangsuensis]|uniref:thioredoxin domain-containing protein n=1 Tax=Nocardioides jiangsuensis TaxID=2866161 RepID=UPI0027E38AF8|nr:thioredoxin domain-containing protein [Nocardioides jiangsuensis]
MNRLADATSPYLLQHKDNPVHWWEWGPDAFEEARRRDVPVLLSVGYAACHWCHVMAHESFEDAATAAFMNDHFVNVKVDREERPDVDAVYMQATTAMTGQGGWPMTVVLNPDGEPFFAGTYFPDRPRHGQPAFTQVLQALADAWRDRRDEVSTVAADVRAHLAGTAGLTGEGDLGEEVLAGAVDTLSGDFDRRSAGFGAAPKFPPSMTLEFLLRHQARTGSVLAGEMVDATCHAMARGGMYDQVGGGFARYSVDRDWVVPHFEKMLYDNAQLLGLYARWWRQGGDPLGARVARETADFLLAELRTPEGGLASALDADSEGVEGRFYAWTPDQLVEVLGPDDGAWAAALLDVTPRGTFEHGTSTLQLRQDPDDPERWASVRSRLAQARAGRVRPARDDKVVAAWNGLAVVSLAEAGRLLDEPRYVDAAVETAELLLDVHLHDGRLRRVSRDGVAGRHAGVLEDYACVAHGFLALVSATGDGRWLRHAGVLLDAALDRFPAGDGGFHDTAEDAETLVARPRDPSDNASPSGQSALVHALLGYAALTGSGRHREAAEGALRTVRALAERVPRFAGWSLAAAEAALAGPLEVAVVGRADDPLRDELEAAARRAVSPGAVVVVGPPASAAGEGAGGADAVPLLEHRDLLDGHAAAYVCRGMVCDRPVGTVEELRELLAR